MDQPSTIILLNGISSSGKTSILQSANFQGVHLHQRYDIEVDTTHVSPQICAEQIRAYFAAHAPTALSYLRQLPRRSIP
jgi:chloramphenicol 3-O-phosphotransferase